MNQTDEKSGLARMSEKIIDARSRYKAQTFAATAHPGFGGEAGKFA
jgi:hypothetical protein